MVKRQGNLTKSPEKIKECIIKHEWGIHLRTAGLFVKTAKKYTADIMVEKDGMEADGKSIIAITTLNAGKNATIKIKACGEDAEQALADLERLIENNFEEP